MQVKCLQSLRAIGRRAASPAAIVLAATLTMVSELRAETEPLAEASRPPGYTGIWIDDTGNGAVEILRCGDALCGRIVWLRKPLDETGAPLLDTLNPKVAERTRPICGLPVIGDLKRQADGSWDSGWVYDPKEGKSYDVAIRLRASDRLEVTGYLGVKLLSETLVWKRAGARIPVCTAKTQDARAIN